MSDHALPYRASRVDAVLVWLLALLWIAPLAWALWAATHANADALTLDWRAPVTLEAFQRAWSSVPFPTYLINTILFVSMLLVCQLVVATLAAYALAHPGFRWRDTVFAFLMLHLLVAPELLLVQNYQTIASVGLIDTRLAMMLPYTASAFAVFLLRQAFRQVPRELEDAARLEGASTLQILLRLHIPLAAPAYLAFALVAGSFHWNNFLWPLIVTNSPEKQVLTVGLHLFAGRENGIDWSLIMAGALITCGPLVLLFLVMQRRFMQTYMRAGIR